MHYSNFVTIDRNKLADKTGLSKKFSERIIYRAERIFASTEIKGKRILDIGAGSGFLSCILSLAGAQSVTAIEPELAGSWSGALDKFKVNLKKFGVDNVKLVKDTLQNYKLDSHSFDIAVSVNSVNHWDEDSLVKLHQNNRQACQKYIDLFRKIKNSLRENGQLLLFEAGRKNLFSGLWNTFGIRNPLSPSVDWHKHQQPQVWAELIRQAEFNSVNYKWLFPILPGTSFLLDNNLFNNKVLSYLTTSKFILCAQK